MRFIWNYLLITIINTITNYCLLRKSQIGWIAKTVILNFIPKYKNLFKNSTYIEFEHQLRHTSSNLRCLLLFWIGNWYQNVGTCSIFVSCMYVLPGESVYRVYQEFGQPCLDLSHFGKLDPTIPKKITSKKIKSNIIIMSIHYFTKIKL